MRTVEEYEQAKQMLLLGQSDGEIARALGIPRRTINGWRRCPRTRHIRACPDPDWRPAAERAYAYSLGLYLGDGHIACAYRAPFLRVSLDSKYPLIVSEAEANLAAVFSDASVRTYTYRPEVRIIQLSHRSLPTAFPQHGAGPKHLREIVLEAWQRGITERHPEALLRGLIHSDGSRCLNRFEVSLPSGRVGSYAYPRYFFTNMSKDIREIFRDHCALLGIRCTQSNYKNMSVAHRDSVALLDAFIGPKR